MKNAQGAALATVHQLQQGQVPHAGHRAPAQHQQPVTDIPPEAVALIDTLFEDLKACFTGWRQAFNTQRGEGIVKQNWVLAFAAAGIRTQEQITRGMARARQQKGDFFPSVGKFIDWCLPTPEELGMPSLDAAWLEAQSHAHEVTTWGWSHPAVRLAGGKAGWSDIRMCSEDWEQKKIRDRFEQAYSALTQQTCAGDPNQLLLTDFNREPAIKQHEREMQARQQAELEAAGMPAAMNAQQGLALIKAQLKQTPQGIKRRRGNFSEVDPEVRAQVENADRARLKAQLDKLMGGQG